MCPSFILTFSVPLNKTNTLLASPCSQCINRRLNAPKVCECELIQKKLAGVCVLHLLLCGLIVICHSALFFQNRVIHFPILVTWLHEVWWSSYDASLPWCCKQLGPALWHVDRWTGYLPLWDWSAERTKPTPCWNERFWWFVRNYRVWPDDIPTGNSWLS